MRVLDANGQEVARTVADGNARYEVQIPSSAALPLTVEASGGTDLVTGRGVDFVLAGAVTDPGAQTVNISPLSSLAVGSASCGRSLTSQSLAGALEDVLRKMSMGLDRDALANPISDEIDPDNVATFVLSNEMLGEAVRRTTNALAATGADVDADDVLALIACDLQDGALDGAGGNADARTTATFRAAEIGVTLEALAGRLEVDGQDATALMDQSIFSVMGASARGSVRSAANPQALAEQATEAVTALQAGVADATLEAVVGILADGDSGSLPTRVDSFLTAARQNDVSAVQSSVALADSSAIAALATRMRAQATAPRPFVSLSSTAQTVSRGASVTLSWASADAERCVATGGWQGRKGAQGTERIGSIAQSARYQLTCTGAGGAASATVVVDVEGEPPVSIPTPNQPTPDQPAPQPPGSGSPQPTPTAPPATPQPPANTPAPGPAPEPPSAAPPPSALPPIASISASARSIARGENITLRWSSSNAQSCEASGGWSGTLSARGSRTIGPLSQTQTYRLTCRGEGGSAIAMVRVTVQTQAGFNLRWAPPEENEDGSLVTELDGYRIYYGDSAGRYPDMEEINDPRVTSHTVPVTPGTYYVVMTALDGNGEESGYSNEIVAVVD